LVFGSIGLPYPSKDLNSMSHEEARAAESRFISPDIAFHSSSADAHDIQGCVADSEFCSDIADKPLHVLRYDEAKDRFLAADSCWSMAITKYIADASGNGVSYQWHMGRTAGRYNNSYRKGDTVYWQGEATLTENGHEFVTHKGVIEGFEIITRIGHGDEGFPDGVLYSLIVYAEVREGDKISMMPLFDCAKSDHA